MFSPFTPFVSILLMAGAVTAAPAPAPVTGSSQAATIDVIAPPVASYGESVTITGNGFGGPNVVVRVGGVVAPVVSATGNRVTFRVPTGVPIGATMVTATNPGGHTGAIGFELSGRITLLLDEAHRAQATIGAAGGAVIAESGGVTFTLTIPAGALPTDEPIVLTPVAGMAGLPLDSLIGAVHFAPEGLQFATAARLEIRPPSGTSTLGLAAFSAAGNGDNLHLTPFMVQEGAINIPILHFSVGGAGTGSPAALNAVACQTTLECTHLTRLSQAWQQARQSVCGAAGCATPAQYGEHVIEILTAFAGTQFTLLGAWFDDVNHMLTTTALTDDAGLRAARLELAAWANYMQGDLCNTDGVVKCFDNAALAADYRTGFDNLAAAFAAAFARARNDCNDRRVQNLAAEVELLGLLGQGPLPANVEELKHQYACQLVITAALPATVHAGDSVPFVVAVAVRTGGPAGPLQPQGGVATTVRVVDGCGQIDGAVSKTAATDPSGTVTMHFVACVSPTNVAALQVSVPDIFDASGVIVAFGRVERYTTHVESAIAIAVSPQNATVNAGQTLAYSATVTGGTLNTVTWSATGGAIQPTGPTTATFTAGNTGGIFGVTATSTDDPSKSQTVPVTVSAGPPAIFSFTFDAGLEGWQPSCALGFTCQSATSSGRVNLIHLGDDPGQVVLLEGTGNPGVPNAWISKGFNLPANVTTLEFDVGGHNRDGADARFVVRIVDANGSTTLIDQIVTGTPEGSARVLTRRSVSIAQWAGRTATILFEQDDNGFVNPDTGVLQLPGGHEQIYLDNIIIR